MKIPATLFLGKGNCAQMTFIEQLL